MSKLLTWEHMGCK